VIAPALAINVVAIPYGQGLAGANDVSYVPRLQKAARSVSATMSSAACAPSRRAAPRTDVAARDIFGSGVPTTCA
jgi:hypothetical protein